MARRGAKAPSAQDGLTGGSVAVVSGSIRTPDDSDALNVKLSIWETEVTMRVDGAELGNWDAADIGIRAIDSTSFEFVAEGDQLIFTPDDPEAFVATSLVKSRGGGGRKRRKRKAKEKAPVPAATAISEGFSPSGDERSGKRRASKTPQPAKPSRRERKAAEKALAEQAAAESTGVDEDTAPPEAESAVHRPSRAVPDVRAEAVPTPIGDVKMGTGPEMSTAVTNEEPAALDVPVLDGPPAAPVELEVEPLGPVEEPPRRSKPPRQKKPPRERAPRRSRSAGATPVEPIPDEPIRDEPIPDEPISDEVDKESRELVKRMWIRALDTARKYDFLGLDRVPVNESLRGQEHQHTWDHRVAPSSGPGKHICTICGEIRR